MKLWIILIGISLIGCTSDMQTEESAAQYQVIVPEPDPWTEVAKSNFHGDFRLFYNRFPDSPHLDSALLAFYTLKRKFMDEQDITPPPWHCGGSCLSVTVNEFGEILCDYQPVSLDTLKARCSNLLIKGRTGNKFSNVKNIPTQDFPDRIISRGHFYIHYLPDADIDLQPAMVAIKQSVDAYKEHLAQSWYGTSFSALPEPEARELDSLNQNRMIISLFSDFTVDDKEMKLSGNPEGLTL